MYLPLNFPFLTYGAERGPTRPEDDTGYGGYGDNSGNYGGQGDYTGYGWFES